jgi:hypothetical protein
MRSNLPPRHGSTTQHPRRDARLVGAGATAPVPHPPETGASIMIPALRWSCYALLAGLTFYGLVVFVDRTEPSFAAPPGAISAARTPTPDR